MNPCRYDKLSFDKVPKNIQQRKDSLFNKLLLGKLDICMQKTETRSMFVSLHMDQLKVD
jgi:hypothetical protein